MKKILVIILGVILFTSCINDSTLDYRDMNAVVVVKIGNKHIFKNLFVPEMDEPYNWEEFPYEVDEPEFNED